MTIIDNSKKYKNKYLKYKNKYLELKGGSSADSTKENLIIFISNDFPEKPVGKGRLPGTIIERKQIFKLLVNDGGSEITETQYKDYFKNDSMTNAILDENTKIIFLTNNTQDNLIANLIKIKERHDYINILLYITTHGSNSQGFARYQTSDVVQKSISLVDILKLLKNESLKNLTLISGACRSEGGVSTINIDAISKIIENTKIILFFPSWRKYASSSHARKGSYEFQALESIIKNKSDILKLFNNYDEILFFIRNLYLNFIAKIVSSSSYLVTMGMFKDINIDLYNIHAPNTNPDLPEIRKAATGYKYMNKFVQDIFKIIKEEVLQIKFDTLKDFLVNKNLELKIYKEAVCSAMPSIYLNKFALEELEKNKHLYELYNDEFQFLLCRDGIPQVEKSISSLIQSNMTFGLKENLELRHKEGTQKTEGDAVYAQSLQPQSLDELKKKEIEYKTKMSQLNTELNTQKRRNQSLKEQLERDEQRLFRNYRSYTESENEIRTYGLRKCLLKRNLAECDKYKCSYINNKCILKENFEEGYPGTFKFYDEKTTEGVTNEMQKLQEDIDKNNNDIENAETFIEKRRVQEEADADLIERIKALEHDIKQAMDLKDYTNAEKFELELEELI